jgi:RNA polymerase subunit RPABC4/transcription elongation factor Spt4
MKEMQTRRTNPDHHHQKTFATAKQAHSSPEAELIALAKSKGQPLTEHTVGLVRDTLELRGVTLEAFVGDVRPHFRNNILNPSGFLIDRARRFHELARPAAVRVSSTPVQVAMTTTVCGVCKGQKFVLTEREIKPCPECSTAEFRRDWQAKEAERARRIDSEKAALAKAKAKAAK